MAPSAVRSFAITLAIAIAIIGPPVSGFVTNRTYIITTPIGIDGKDISLDGKLDESKITTILSNNTTINNSSDEATTQKTTENQEKKTEKTLSAQTTMKIMPTTEYMKIPTLMSDTVEVFDSGEYVTETKNRNTENDVNLSQSVISLPKKTQQRNTEKEKNMNLVIATTTIADQLATETETLKELSTQISFDNTMMNTKSDEATTVRASSDINTEAYVKTPTTSILSAVTNHEDHEGTLTTTIIPKITKARAPINIFDTTTSDISDMRTETIFSTTIFNQNSPTEASSIINSNFEMNDTTMYTSNTKNVEPLRKNYTTIVRKRISTDEPALLTTQSESEHMKAETSNIFMNYEKADVTPDLSKKTTFLPNTNLPIISTVDTGKTTLSVDTIIRSINSIESTEDKGTATVETKRAGYLDNSDKSSKRSGKSKDYQANDEEVHGIGDDTMTPEIVTHNTKATISESQSQLAEDALQEELLEEEAIKNRQENINRYGNEDATSTNTTDTLSVQPIEQAPERTRTTLYTVSPNYKPMKKIEVQPAKPFVRDPDDNSWRNESISSLGIVFKPKNSSISFKEVLKNKTQTELNSLQEKDARDDVPDLRVRLEKIAEVRKTKKKKTNKDGEVVYTDYEEGGSAESNNTGKVEPIFSTLGSSEIFQATTTSQPDPPTDFKATTPMGTVMDLADDKKGGQSLFNELGPLTTHKPNNKLFNIAEYYDTTDEYDADYAKLPNIDLKKFTVDPRTTRPPAPPTSPLGPQSTRPMHSFPDRRPTVQYFPPRTTLKGGNSVDGDFQKKVNSFTFENSPQPHFMTVPPAPVAPATPEPQPYEQRARPTPPPEFAPYTPGEDYYPPPGPPAPEAPPRPLAPYGPSPHRGSYLIKHYKDFLNAVAKDDEDDRPPFAPFPPAAPRGFEGGERTPPPDDFEAQLRRDALFRFVDDFNRNSERFKVDFPILYNNSVVHRAEQAGRAAASSRAFLRRLYGAGAAARRACDACDLTVELSPAYELHYYVPEQEEKGQPEPQPAPPAPAAPAPAAAAVAAPALAHAL